MARRIDDELQPGAFRNWWAVLAWSGVCALLAGLVLGLGFAFGPTIPRPR